MKKRVGSLLFLLVLVVVSCGGDSASSSTGASVSEPTGEASQQVVIDPEALAVAATIVDHLGPGVAFEAVVLALGAGYRVGQIVDGAAVLEADGSISGVSPGDPPSGLLADGPSAFGGSVIILAAPVDLALADGGVTLDDIVAAFDRDMSSGAFLPGEAPEPVSMEERHQVETVVAGILGLVDAGYSLDQIIEGLVLGEQRWSVATDDIQVCVVLAEADGTLVAPAKKSKARFSRSGDCNRRIRDGSLDVFIDGELVQGVVTTTTTTTATATGDNDDGTIDGVYLGEVEAPALVDLLDIVSSRVELTVTEGTVHVSLELTMHLGTRYQDDVEVCTATVSRTFSGTGPMADPLSLPMQPMSQEIISLEGPECGIVEGSWDTTAEADLLAEFAEEEIFDLLGAFRDGRFEGTLAEGVLEVTAVRS